VKILVVSPTPTHPQNAGNRARIYRLLASLKSQGHEIHLLLDNRESLSNHVTSNADIGAMSKTWHEVHVCEPLLPWGAKDEKHPSLSRNGSTSFADRFRGWRTKSHNAYQCFRKYLRRFHELIRKNLWRLRIPFHLLKGNAWRLRYGPGRVMKSHFPSVYGRLHPQFRRIVKPKAEIVRKQVLQKQATQIQAVHAPASDNPVTEVETKPPVDQRPDIDRWYDPRIDSMALYLHKKHKYDAVIVMYVFMSRVLENFDRDVLKIIDTNDCFTERNEKLESKGISDTFFSTSATQEAAGLNRADRIIAIQEKEYRYFQSLTDRDVVTIGHAVELIAPVPRRETIKNILYVGSGNIINIHGLKSFLDHALPLVRARFPEARLIVAGNVCNFLPDHDGLDKLGELADIQNAYALADVVINPAMGGTGLKIKNVEALGRGKILITSSHGAEGVGAENPPFLIADSAAEFAARIVDIMLDLNRYNELREEAYRYARRYNQRQFDAIGSLLRTETNNHRAP